MKQATIKCPHCGRQITVRQAEETDQPELWAAFDKVFDEMDEFFRKFFRPMFRK